MANSFLGNATSATTASNAANLNGQAASYYLNFNNFAPVNQSVAGDNITRRPIVLTTAPQGYMTRAAVGVKRVGDGGWGEAIFSVGNNDDGTSFVDFRFNVNGRIYSPAGTFALQGEAQPANGGTSLRSGGVNVAASNETIIADGYKSTGDLYVNFRSASAATPILRYKFCKGINDTGALSDIYAANYYGTFKGNADTATTATSAATATNATQLGGVAASNYARRDTDNNFVGKTNTQRALIARHLDGLAVDNSSPDTLYLNYNANKPIAVGYQGRYTISSDGGYYSGRSANSDALGGQTGAYYLNFNNLSNKPSDVSYAYFTGMGAVGATNIPVMFGQSSTATSYNKLAFCRWSSTDPFNFGVGSYGTAIGWHGSDTGGVIAVSYNSPNAVISGIQGTANQYKNWQRKICLYDADGVSFTSTNSNALGGVAASSYINTGDTLILRGTV